MELRNGKVISSESEANTLCVLQGDSWEDFDTHVIKAQKLHKLGFTFVETFETKNGRKDTIFYVKEITQFAMIRLRLRMCGIMVMWWEDAIDNGGRYYPHEILTKYPQRHTYV